MRIGKEQTVCVLVSVTHKGERSLVRSDHLLVDHETGLGQNISAQDSAHRSQFVANDMEGIPQTIGPGRSENTLCWWHC